MDPERLSILITDIESSTAIAAARGDHASVELIRTHHRLLGELLVQRGGKLVKSMGDGLMVEFGSAAAAVECALDMQASLTSYNESHASDPIGIRMGINTGAVIREEGDLYGTTVNAASRIAAKARSGQVLVARITREEAEAEASCSFIDRGLFWLKGLREQWRLYEATRDPAASLPPGLGEGRAPFVDRETERASLRRHLDEAISGSGALVVLAGEVGAGKTRLAEEIGAEAQARGVTAVFARCYETARSQAYTPLIETFEAIERTLDPQTLRSVLGETAPEIARIAPSIRRSLPDLPPPAELPPAQEQRYLFGSARDALAAASALRPLLLVWDDLHWADPSTLQFLEYFAPDLGRLPVLLLGVYTRTEPAGASELTASIERLHRRHLIAHNEVTALRLEDIHRLLEAMTGTEPPQDLVERLYRETEGNAFFIEEVVRRLLESREVLDANKRWAADATQRLDLPESVRLSVGRRIDSLTKQCRALLTSAALLGRAFGFAVIEALSDLGEDELLDALDEAERAGLVRSAVEGGVVRFQFTHELIRRALAEELSPARRQRMNLRAADAIERTHPAELEEHAARIAQHLWEAGTLAPPEKTAHFSVMAAARAISAAAYPDALTHVERALALLPDEPAPRAPALELLAQAQRGQPSSAMSSWMAALDAYEEAGDLEAIPRLCLDAGLQVAWWQRGRGTRELVGRGLDAVGNAQSPLRAGLLALEGSMESQQGNYERGTKLLDEALAMVSGEGDPRILGIVHYSRAAHHFAYNEFLETIESGNDSVRHLRAAGDLWNLANALGYIAASHSWVGDYERAREVGREADELGRRLENWSAYVFGNRAHTYPDFCASPDFRWYEQDGRNAVALGEEQGFQWLVAVGQTRMGLAAFWRGEWEEALGFFEEAARVEPGGASGGHRGPLALANTYLGNWEEASRLLEASRDDFPTSGARATMTNRSLALVAVEAFSLMGRDEEAAALRPTVEDILSTGSIARGWDNRLMHTLAGIAAGSAGDWEGATEHFESALRLVESLPNRLEEGDACRFYARMLMDEESHLDRARELLERARGSYQRIGMRRHAALAQDMLDQLSARPAR